ncbi:MAG: hypothetical protein ACTHMV_09480 [Chitinophagaceae bacterium]
MRKIFLILIAVVSGTTFVSAQSPTQQVAATIAQKMKDSLQLSESQRLQVFNLNIEIANQKTAQRQTHINSDSLGYYLQRVENTRDSLYRPVLGEEKYLLYKQKKRNLVSVN